MLNLALKVALLLCCISSFPARAQEPQPFRGIFCSTADQIRRVVELGSEVGAAHGIQAVNKEVGGEVPACVHVIIVGVRQKSVGTVMTPEGRLEVAPFEVRGIHTPFGIIERATPVVWFTLADPVGQEV